MRKYLSAFFLIFFVSLVSAESFIVDYKGMSSGGNYPEKLIETLFENGIEKTARKKLKISNDEKIICGKSENIPLKTGVDAAMALAETAAIENATELLKSEVEKKSGNKVESAVSVPGLISVFNFWEIEEDEDSKIKTINSYSILKISENNWKKNFQNLMQ